MLWLVAASRYLPKFTLSDVFPLPNTIVGHADARRDVVVAVDAALLGKDDRRRKELHRPDLLFREVAPRVLVAKRALQRQPADGPLLLRVERLVPRAPAAG